MEPDFPAAHSMDTAFFAVDKDGHVAYFTSGEAGAVPDQAFTEHPHQLLTRLAQALPAGEGLHDLQGRLGPGQAGAGRQHCSYADTLLAFLKSLDAVREEIARGQAVQVPASSGVAVVIRDVTPALRQRLHDAGDCLGCFFHYEPGPEYEEPNPAGHGLFAYGHLCENWISGPYGREALPRQPVHIDQLPPDLRAVVGRFRLDTLCFAETPHIQPVEHAECTSWESAYLASDGKTVRPIPGREEEYREVYGEYRKDSRLEIEPPPDEQAPGG
jgi:hypothetical protein